MVARTHETPEHAVLRELLAIDLFAGAGGMSVGLKNAGFRVAGAVEVDSLACETYARNHPDVHLWEHDIRELDGATILTRLGMEKGELDLVAGCPPCQGFSSITTLNGSREVVDSRNELVLEYGRLVSELLPRAVLMENVPGLDNDSRMERLCDLLESLGYPVRTSRRVLNAVNFGVPQRRRRLVMLAAKNASVPFASPSEDVLTVKSAFNGLPPAGQSNDPLHDLAERRSPAMQERIAKTPKDGGSRLDLPLEDQCPCHRETDGFKDIYGRMWWNKPSPTITGGCVNPSKGRFLHPEENRAITLREAAILQGFERDYYFSLKRGKFAAAVMIGNALPPAFVEAHARKLADHLRLAA